MINDCQLIASEWHSGQWSDLYKFQSSGYIEDVDGLISEINACIKQIPSFPEDERDNLEDGLQMFLHTIEQREDLRYDPESGWLMAPWCRAYEDGCKAIIPEQRYQLVADSPDKIRRSDLFRLLEQFESFGEARQMANWLIEQREDLEPDIDIIMGDLADFYA
jgi:hypothetical protein